VDLDGDGHNDILSGSWPGEIFWFRGKGQGDFEAPVKLKNKNGKHINVGGGLRKEEGGEYVLVAGDAKVEQGENGNQVIVYEGERIEVPKGKQAGITGTASAVHATDWDGDGDLDLIVGNIRGEVHLVPNEGTAREYSFGKEQPLNSGGGDVKVGHDAGPFVADWDADGKNDLLLGSGDGSVWFYRNTGTAKEPQLAAGKQLVPPTESRGRSEAPTGVTRGTRSKVCAADWNGDGRLDLLVGDFGSQRPEHKEVTAEEKAEHERIREELKPLERRASELATQLYGSRRDKDKQLSNEEREKLQKERSELYEKMTPLRRKLPSEMEYHGWVWLFLRKADDAAATAGERQPAR
jgi:hypothetical protein